jgi:hypothetical protein
VESFAGPSRVRPPPTRSLRDQLIDLWRWIRPPRPSLRKRIRMERLVERLAAEIEMEEGGEVDRSSDVC